MRGESSRRAKYAATLAFFLMLVGNPPHTLGSDLSGAQIAQDEIERRTLVRDTAVRKEGNRIILVVEMNAAVNERTAKETGEDFVRLFMSFHGQETGSPSKQIGETDFDYQVGIVDSQGNFLYRGAKIDIAHEITW